MEKTLKILEGILEQHASRRNAMHVPFCGPMDLDEDGEFIWRPCGCDDCAALTKAVKRLKKAMGINA